MDNERIAWLKLALAWVSVREFEELAARFGSVAEIAERPAADLERVGLSPKRADALSNPDQRRIETAAAWLDDERHHLMTWGSDDYPALLAGIPDPPLALFVNGDRSVLGLPALAIVGSRNPTAGGKRNAREFAAHLASSGFVIVSGLALGIDAAAHGGALEAKGATIAILGNGIDRVYPAANRDLAHEIAGHGALLSEFPLGTPPDKHHFPLRNRLISGLSVGTLVVEAARRSGSLITARLAGEQGREVFALPGSIHNPLARGCHTLIRQGAKLVETADDIVSELGALVGHIAESSAETEAADDQDEPSELDPYLGHDPVSVDELIDRSGLTIDQVSSMLLILELKGKVERLAGGRYALLE